MIVYDCDEFSTIFETKMEQILCFGCFFLVFVGFVLDNNVVLV